MDSNFGEKLIKTAEEVAGRLGEAAHSAGERLNEMVEIQRLNKQIRMLQLEKDLCKMAMADLLIRMFDQETFAEALLRPEYLRIKEIGTEVCQLEQEKEQLLHHGIECPPAETPAPAEVVAPETAASVEEHTTIEDEGPTADEG